MASKKLSKPQPFSSTPPSDSSPDDELFARMESDAGMGVDADPDDGEPGDEIDPLAGLAFGPTLLEKMLLAIIDGHPHGNRRKRLDAAMKALVGRKAFPGHLPPDPGRKTPADDVLIDRALLWMAAEYAAAGTAKPADLALAQAATRKFFGTPDPTVEHARIEGLRKKFSGAYGKRLKSWNSSNPEDVRHTFLYRATQHDYLVESIEAQILRRVRDEFAQVGLRMILSEDVGEK